MKVYVAKSVVFISVKVGLTTKNISFRQKYGGGSVYSTDDPREIDAIESHKWFGSIIRVDVRHSTPIATEPKKVETEEVNDELESVLVSSCVEARDFLAERGISVTSARSREAIKKLGAENGFAFEGI